MHVVKFISDPHVPETEFLSQLAQTSHFLIKEILTKNWRPPRLRAFGIEMWYLVCLWISMGVFDLQRKFGHDCGRIRQRNAKWSLIIYFWDCQSRARYAKFKLNFELKSKTKKLDAYTRKSLSPQILTSVATLTQFGATCLEKLSLKMIFKHCVPKRILQQIHIKMLRLTKWPSR